MTRPAEGEGEAPGVRCSREAREAELRRWLSFLEAECARPDGLLCYYDLHKSPRVLNSCQILARSLLAPARRGTAGGEGEGRHQKQAPLASPAPERPG